MLSPIDMINHKFTELLMGVESNIRVQHLATPTSRLPTCRCFNQPIKIIILVQIINKYFRRHTYFIIAVASTPCHFDAQHFIHQYFLRCKENVSFCYLEKPFRYHADVKQAGLSSYNFKSLECQTFGLMSNSNLPDCQGKMDKIALRTIKE